MTKKSLNKKKGQNKSLHSKSLHSKSLHSKSLHSKNTYSASSSRTKSHVSRQPIYSSVSASSSVSDKDMHSHRLNIPPIKDNILSNPVKASNNIVAGKSYLYFKVILIVLAVFILGSSITFYLFVDHKIIDYKEINTSATITAGGIGLNADKDVLRFGKNHPGGEAVRYFSITSPEDALVKIRTSGSISDMIYYSENDFVLYANQTRKITVTLVVPQDIMLGEYIGKVKVYLLRP